MARGPKSDRNRKVDSKRPTRFWLKSEAAFQPFVHHHQGHDEGTEGGGV